MVCHWCGKEIPGDELRIDDDGKAMHEDCYQEELRLWSGQ
jgi:hypothetical protein